MLGQSGRFIGVKFAHSVIEAGASLQGLFIQVLVHYPYPGWPKSTWILIRDAFEKIW
jgi:hypothetical protein